jgi:flagellar protein FlaG
MVIQNSIALGHAAQPDVRVGEVAPRAAAQVAAVAAAEPSPQQVRQAVASISQALRQSNSNLEFSIDPGTHRVVVKVLDRETGDLIRQIPSREVLAIAESIGQYQKGLLFSQEA